MSAPLRLVGAPAASEAAFHGMIGRHPKMKALFEDIRHAAPLPVPVLIDGPTGAGKELVACAVHELSGRTGPLVVVNASELAESLMEAELFGVTKGAYTGASHNRSGLVEAAARGTLFLDEASDLSPHLQAKLLRVIETERVRRLGSVSDRRVDFRLLVSVQRPAVELVSEGRWRPDFYYRVAGLRLRVPALRDRLSDVPELARHFLAGLGGCPANQDALEPLLSHGWPGNVRELRRVMERAVHRARHRHVHAADVASVLEVEPSPGAGSGEWKSLKEAVRDAERAHIWEALRSARGDARAAAAALAISRSTLYRRLEALGLQAPDGSRGPDRG